MKKLFTERHGHVKPRVSEMLDETTRNALLTLLSARIDEEWFGMSFPDKCGDGYAYAGTDLTKLRETMNGYGLLWPHDISRQHPPDDGHIFDLLEFSYEFAAEALKALGVKSVRLLSNNPDKVQQLEESGIRVVERVPCRPPTSRHSRNRRGLW